MGTPVGGNEVPAPPAAQGRWRRDPSRDLGRALAEPAYVLAVAGIATWGFSTESAARILLAVVLALPAGVPAVVGYYVTYGLLALLPGAHSSSSVGAGRCSADGFCHESSTGDPAVWFTHTMDIVGILALTAAAVLNVVLVRLLLARRRARTQRPASRSR